MKKTNKDFVLVLDKDFVYHGFRCVVRHNDMGFRLGYVVVDNDHPLYGFSCGQLEEQNVEVHGGLTWAGKINESKEWWIGFDCSHFGDAPDPELMSETFKNTLLNFHLFQKSESEIRTEEYVIDQLHHLVEQLEQLGFSDNKSQEPDGDED